MLAFPAGKVIDTLMRSVAAPLTRELGQPIIIDNRPGGGGVVGTDSVARAAKKAAGLEPAQGLSPV